MQQNQSGLQPLREALQEIGMESGASEAVPLLLNLRNLTWSEFFYILFDPAVGHEQEPNQRHFSEFTRHRRRRLPGYSTRLRMRERLPSS